MSKIPAYTHEGCEALIVQGIEAMLEEIRAMPDPLRRTASLLLLEMLITTGESMFGAPRAQNAN